MTDIIQTVTGGVRPDDITGTILPHEHLLIDYGDLTGDPRDEVTPAVVDAVCHGVMAARSAGVDLLVDCTPPGYGRYLDVMREVSNRTGVLVVFATGSFCEAWAPLPKWVQPLEIDAMADYFVRELAYGAGGTTWRAGIIKAATGERITVKEERVLRAAGRASVATGASIVSHTTGGLGDMALDIYLDEGVPAPRVTISHVGFEPDPHTYVVGLARRGAYVGLDRIGHHHFHPDSHWIDLLKTLRQEGLLHRALLSHDAVTRFSGPAAIGEHTFSDYSYLSRRFLPQLLDAGFNEEEVELLSKHIPRRWLSGQENTP